MTVPQHQHGDPAKSSLRHEIGDRRRARSDAERAEVAAALAVRLGSIPEIAALVADPSAGCLAAYASYAGEPGTAPMRALLELSGVRVLLPVIGEDGGLDWAWDEGDLAERPLSRGIPEPAGDIVGHGADGLALLDARVLLVPATAVDYAGHRLGKGGGYYDRLFAALADSRSPERPLLVAVVHDDEVLDSVPHEPHDRPVDAVLTQTRLLRVR